MGNIYINKDLCSKCKGSCCKVSGCMYMPSDFKKMKYITIKKELLKGNISIDAFPVKGFNFNLDAWTLILFLRARNKDKDVVDLFTSGGPCKMLGLVLEKFDDENIVPILKLDVDEAKDVAEEYKVFTIPTLIIFENGKEIKRKVGYQSLDELREWVNDEE